MSIHINDKIEFLDCQKQECSFRVLLARDPEAGGFTVVIPELPGIVSQGENEEQALNNIRDAFALAAREYLKDEGKIPWQKPCDEVEAQMLSDWREEGIFDIISNWIHVDVK